ncbi:MAG: hypothetical protein IPG90_08400 [Bacteroidetes bacterium]|nr:hypothetical protein [Bacteroidota bacterium]
MKWGILQGGTIPNCKTTVEYCEFLNGGSSANPGYQHNIYINHIDTLIFRYNFSYNSIAKDMSLRAERIIILFCITLLPITNLSTAERLTSRMEEQLY